MGIKSSNILKKIIIFLILVIVGYSFFLIIYNKKYQPSLDLTFESMNTFVNIKIYDKKDKKELAKATQEVFNLFKHLDSLWNPYDSNSSVFKINHRDTNIINLDPYTYEIIKRSLEFHNQYSDKFNIAVGRLIDFWKKYKKLNKMPCPCNIKRVLVHCNINDIILDDNTSKAKFMDPYLKIDFGAVAKGYALSKAKDIFSKYNIKYFIINAGGDIYLTSKFNKKISVGIVDPFNKEKIIMRLKLKNISVATSGDYERGFTIEGKKFSHIIDPANGYPLEKFNSATAIIDDPFLADAWATVLTFGTNHKKLPSNLKYILISQDTIIKKL